MLIKAAEARKQLAEFGADWEVNDTSISKEFTLLGFHQAMDFVNQTAVEAMKYDHHPDIDIRFNKVKIFLTTKDEGGITKKDIEMARAIEDFEIIV